jgi:hypothetical protein
MTAYLAYWKPREVDWDDPGSHVLRHAWSQQYHKIGSGDRVYLITSHRGTLYLLGRIDVDARVGRLEAASRLGLPPDELTGDHHIFAAPGAAMPITPIPCEDALRKVYTVAAGKAQQIKEPIHAQRFQTMRQISPGSATILDDLLAGHAST